MAVIQDSVCIYQSSGFHVYNPDDPLSNCNVYAADQRIISKCKAIFSEMSLVSAFQHCAGGLKYFL